MKEYLPRKSVVLKISRFFLVIILVFSWIFSGWSQIFNFPPKVQVAQAAFTAVAATNSGNSGGNTTNHIVIIDTVIDFYIML